MWYIILGLYATSVSVLKTIMKAIITSIREHIGMWVFKGKRL